MEYIFIIISTYIFYILPNKYIKELELEQSRYCEKDSKPVDMYWFIRKGIKTPISFVLAYVVISLLILMISKTLLNFYFIESIFLILSIASYIDFKIKIIPDSTYIYLIPLGLIFSGYVLDVPLEYSIYGMVLGYISMYLILWITSAILKKEAMGMGDVKLLSSIGAILGIYLIPIVLLISSLVALLAIPLMKEREKPFGPFLSFSVMLLLILNELGFDIDNIASIIPI